MADGGSGDDRVPRVRQWLRPRALSKADAAAYVGCRTVRAFDAQMRRGLFPPAMAGTTQWDRRALDAAVSRLSAASRPSGVPIAAVVAESCAPAAPDHAGTVDLAGVRTAKRPLANGDVAVHYYHRATNTKLPGKPGSREFTGALEAARAGPAATAAVAAVAASTFAGLIRQFCASAEWRGLAAKTREDHRLNLRAVEDRWGALPLDALAGCTVRADVLAWRDHLAERHPRAADMKVKAAARVLSWGLDRGLVQSNPLAGARGIRRRSRADRIWLPEHVAAFAAAASPRVRLALMLALHTGQRQGDIRALTWAAYDGAALTLQQGKTGRRVWVPCTGALRAALDAAPRSGATILTDRGGGLWEKRAFARAWDRVYGAAGLPEGAARLHFHDLRGTAVTMLSEAGATPQEVAAITGHTLASVSGILDVYLSRTRALAESAIAKLELHGARPRP